MKFGGRTLEQIAAAQQPKTQQEPGKDRITDPYPVPSGRDQQHLLSVFGDFTQWTEQLLCEMARLARKSHRLEQKLKDPALQDSPQIGEARLRQRAWRDELADQASAITDLEAQCDRYWQAMTPQSRLHYGLDWHSDGTNDRIIGRAFTVLARKYRWPPWYSVSLDLLRHCKAYVRMELNDHGFETVWLGEQHEWDK